MRRNEQRRRGLWALALSVALHALIALVLVVREKPVGPSAPASRPIEITINMIEPPKAAPQPVAPAAVAPRVAVKKKVGPAVEAPVQPAPSAGTEPKAGAQNTGAKDAPRAVTLVPGGDFPMATAGIEPEAPRGHTVVNSEQEHPDPVAMAEYTSEKLGRRTGQMVEGMVSSAKAKSGLVHPYFTGARAALEGDLSNGDVPLPKEKNLAREGLKGYMKSTENFGRTGNPFAPGETPKWDNFSIARNETQGMAMQARDPEWAGIMRQAEQQMGAGEATNRMFDHALLEAVLELVQEPGGGVADAHIVKSSGYAAFDEYVLHRARKVFLKLDDPPDDGHGISQAGWRTLWRFRYFPMSMAEKRGQRVRVELISVTPGQGSGNPLEHVTP